MGWDRNVLGEPSRTRLASLPMWGRRLPSVCSYGVLRRLAHALPIPGPDSDEELGYYKALKYLPGKNPAWGRPG
jgi:hypothetical protein